MRDKNPKSCRPALKTNGFSLVELMITVGLGIVIVGGLGTLFVNITDVQSAVSTQTQLAQTAARITTALSDPTAWANTLAAATPTGVNRNLYCMTTKTPTCVPTVALPFDTIKDASNATIYLDNGSNGFSYQGVQCTGFSTSTPNDACPFSYHLTAQYSCPQATSCLTPQVTILATLNYAPSAGSKLRVLNLDKYQVRVIKGLGTQRNDIIQITEQTNGPPPYPPIPTGTVCNAGGISRKFTTIVMDSACTVSGGPPSGTCNVYQAGVAGVPTTPVKFRAGTYVCFASAEGYAIGGFNISVKVNGAVPVEHFSSPPAVAPESPAGPGTTTLQNFKVSSATDFTIEIVQNCVGGSTVSQPYDFGLPVRFPPGAYGINVYSTLSCTRLL